MAQEQPSSLPYWRGLQAQIGADRTIAEAAQEIDAHLEELGRLRDLRVTINVAMIALAFAFGVLFGFLICKYRVDVAASLIGLGS